MSQRRAPDRKYRRFLQDSGRPLTVTDPAEIGRARSKVRALHGRGMTYAQMAVQAGRETLAATFRDVACVGRPALLRSTINAIDALRFEPPVRHGALIPAVGSRRRLQALVAIGFTVKSMNVRFGWHWQDKTLVVILKGRRDTVTAGLAARIAEMFEELENSKAEELVDAIGWPERTRAKARREGYAPRSCWDPDTIDDPHAYPEWTGACGTIDGYRIHLRDKIPMCPLCGKEFELCERELPEFSAEKFRAARLGAGYSQAVLERMTGLSKGIVSHWEKGAHSPSMENLDKALSVLGCTFEDVTY